MKSDKQTKICCSTRQKVLGVVALVGLFACGAMIGWTFNNGTPKQNNNNIETAKSQPTEQNNDNRQTCEVIEEELQYDIGRSTYNDIITYTKLVKYGCAENQNKWTTKLDRAKQIYTALNDDVQPEFNYEEAQSDSTCTRIESELTKRLWNSTNMDSYEHINNAKIYANLSERGCPENSQKYVNLAQSELEIARALEDDKLNQDETVEVVETYKRIQMQNAAREILDKAKKVTDPAIDFIIQLEKIINE